MSERVAVVSGGNKGIGLEICRQLAGTGVNVVLTARNADRGTRAAKALQREGLNVIYHPLEVTSPDAIGTLADYMTRSHGRCDILVNNAGIALKGSAASLLQTREALNKSCERNPMICRLYRGTGVIWADARVASSWCRRATRRPRPLVLGPNHPSRARKTCSELP